MMELHPAAAVGLVLLLAVLFASLIHHWKAHRKFERMYLREYKSKEEAFIMMQEYREVTLELKAACDEYRKRLRDCGKDPDEEMEA